MSYGVFRRRPVARRLPYSRRALAVLTAAGAAPATTSLPLARRGRPPAHLFRPRFAQYRRRRGIAGLPNADPVVSLPMVRRRPSYSLYLHPDPPIVRLRRMVIGLPNADAAAESFVFFGEAIWRVDPTEFPTGAVFKCAYVIQVDAVSGQTAKARLMNVTTSVALVGSGATTTVTSPTFLVSGAFTLTAGLNDYRPQIGGAAGEGATFTMFVCQPFISSS